MSLDREGYNVLHRVLQHVEELTLKFLLDNPLIFKSLLVTKDNSSSRLPPMFFLHTEKRNKTIIEQKENYTKMLFQAIEDSSITPTDIKDVFLTIDAYDGTLVHYAAGLGNTLMLRKILEGLDEKSRFRVFVWRNAANATPI